MQCDQCDKKFYKLGNLKRHKFIHTEDKPFQCDQCDKKFNQLTRLKTHKHRLHTYPIDPPVVIWKKPSYRKEEDVSVDPDDPDVFQVISLCL